METIILSGLLITGYLSTNHYDNVSTLNTKKSIQNKSKKKSTKAKNDKSPHKQNSMILKKTLSNKGTNTNTNTNTNINKNKLNTMNNNSIFISELTGLETNKNHNNMVHFYKGDVTQNMDLSKPNRNLQLFTGGDDLKKPKQEVGPLFDNTRQNIFGMQNYTESYKNNINQSRYENHNLPFEQIKIGPGIGLDYDDGPTGGYQQDIRRYEMPKTVDELRAKNNPKISYRGKLIKGKKEIKRDAGYNFTKNKKAVMAVNREQHPTYGVEKNKPRPKIYISENGRRISKNLFGPAGNTIIKNKVSQKHRPSNKLSFEVDTTRNFNDTKKYDLNKNSYYCAETKKEEQASLFYKKKLYAGSIIKALIPTTHNQDNARMTIKETTENNKELLNLKGNEKITMYNKQPARKTIRETTEDNIKDIINIKLYKKLPERVKQKIKTTLKETLLDNNHGGFIHMDKKKTTLRNLDSLKTTLKETLLRDSELLNMLAGYKSKKHFDDIAKTTHKETYADNFTVGGSTFNKNDGYKSANYDMVETNKEFTCNNDYTGIANREDGTGYMSNKYDAKETNKESYVDKDYYGSSLGNKEMMSYEDMYNATINDLKEKTLKGRAPTKENAKQSIGSKDINLEIKCDLLRKTQEPMQKTLIHNSIVDKNSIVSTSNKNNAINDIIRYNESNNLSDLTKQLENNPLAISIV